MRGYQWVDSVYPKYRDAHSGRGQCGGYGKAAAQLGPQQVLCGNLDPTVDVLSGKPEDFGEKVRRIYQQTGNRTIMAAGCDVPPDTPEENVRAFYQACVNLER
ncbi:MAG: uroporphyrinogen decarboxylase family protein [Clostridia bacterium]